MVRTGETNYHLAWFNSNSQNNSLEAFYYYKIISSQVTCFYVMLILDLLPFLRLGGCIVGWLLLRCSLDCRFGHVRSYCKTNHAIVPLFYKHTERTSRTILTHQSMHSCQLIHPSTIHSIPSIHPHSHASVQQSIQLAGPFWLLIWFNF